MTLSERKQSVKRHMEILVEAKQYLQEHNCSKAAQMEIRNDKLYDGFLVEIESAVVGGTNCDWIRLCYDDVYLYFHGEDILSETKESYEYDPYGEYGAELITADTHEDFLRQLDEISEDLEHHYDW